MEYAYGDIARPDILAMIPEDGAVIGSIGCGSAATEAALVKRGREVHGVDIDAGAIERARTRLSSARVVSPDEITPFEQDSLDGLILADVIEHMPLADQALARMVRMVRRGGWVVISVPNMRSIVVLVRFLLQGDWPEHPTGIFDRTHVQVMTRKRLTRWCGGADLRIERWFPRYDPNNPGRERLFRVTNTLTLHIFNEWFMFQHQVLARRL